MTPTGPLVKSTPIVWYNPESPPHFSIEILYDRAFNDDFLPTSVKTKNPKQVRLTPSEWPTLGFDQCPVHDPYINWPRLPIHTHLPWQSEPITRNQKSQYHKVLNQMGGICTLHPYDVADTYFHHAKAIILHRIRLSNKHLENTILHDRALANCYYFIFFCGCFSRGISTLKLLYPHDNSMLSD